MAESEAAEGGSGGATPVFGVNNDIEAARAALEGKGVRFEGDIIEMPGLVKLTTFKDPDGNSYMFANRWPAATERARLAVRARAGSRP